MPPLLRIGHILQVGVLNKGKAKCLHLIITGLVYNVIYRNMDEKMNSARQLALKSAICTTKDELNSFHANHVNVHQRSNSMYAFSKEEPDVGK